MFLYNSTLTLIQIITESKKTYKPFFMIGIGVLRCARKYKKMHVQPQAQHDNKGSSVPLFLRILVVKCRSME